MDYTNSTLVTDFNGADVMVFTTEKITHQHVEFMLKLRLISYSEVIKIESDDLQHYVYQPCWLNAETEAIMLKFSIDQNSS